MRTLDATATVTPELQSAVVVRAVREVPCGSRRPVLRARAGPELGHYAALTP